MTNEVIEEFAHDLDLVWGKLAGAAEDGAAVFLTDAKAGFAAIGPEQYKLLRPYIIAAIDDAGTGDVGDVTSVLLNAVEAELPWAKTLGSALLGWLIAGVQTAQAAL